MIDVNFVLAVQNLYILLLVVSFVSLTVCLFLIIRFLTNLSNPYSNPSAIGMLVTPIAASLAGYFLYSSTKYLGFLSLYITALSK